MALSAEDYHLAALEHLALAHRAYDAKEYIATHYFSGVAVECLFRAYSRLIDDTFRSEHDLERLAVASRLFNLLPDKSRHRWQAKVGDLNARWRSSHRYYSERALRQYLKKAGLDRKIKGDVLKETARIVRELAQEIVGLGEAKWRSKKKSER